MFHKFSLANLADLDQGSVRDLFDAAVKRCISDCKDRPASDKDRTVTMQVFVRPVAGKDGACEGCTVQFAIAEKLPKQESTVFRMHEKQGVLLFSDESPDQPGQTTIQTSLKKA